MPRGTEKTVVIDTPEGIHVVRLLAMRSRLALELKGMKSRISTWKILKSEFGFKGNKAKVLQTENFYLADNNKNMDIVTDELYFILD